MCEFNGKSLELCKTMQELIDPQKGLDFTTLSNFNTGEQTRQLVIVKTGEHRKKGIVFNFCPITGKCIEEHTFNELVEEIGELMGNDIKMKLGL